MPKFRSTPFKKDLTAIGGKGGSVGQPMLARARPRAVPGSGQLESVTGGNSFARWRTGNPRGPAAPPSGGGLGGPDWFVAGPDWPGRRSPDGDHAR